VRCQTELRVGFSDTDAAGITHYARYLAFFEAGRVEALRDVGLAEAESRPQRPGLRLVEAHLRYRSPTRFDDQLCVQTWVAELRQKDVRFAYEIRRQPDDAIAASGETWHIFVDVGSTRGVPPPAWLWSGLARLQDGS
jgi:acyl-CoA thioester hydrolase